MTDVNTEIKGFIAIASYRHREKNTLQSVDIFYDMDNCMFLGHYRDNLKINTFDEVSCQQELEEELTAFLRPISKKGPVFKKRYIAFFNVVMEQLKDAEPSTIHIDHSPRGCY